MSLTLLLLHQIGDRSFQIGHLLKQRSLARLIQQAQRRPRDQSLNLAHHWQVLQAMHLNSIPKALLVRSALIIVQN